MSNEQRSTSSEGDVRDFGGGTQAQEGTTNSGGQNQDGARNSEKSYEAVSQENPNQVQPKNALTNEQMERELDAYIKEYLDKGIVAYNAIRIKDKYPKAYRKFVKYIDSVATIPGVAADDETMIGILLYSPRTIIFNFFDDNTIFVLPKFAKVNRKWYYEIVLPQADAILSGEYDNRTEAEVSGFMKAFEILEKQ